MKNWKKAKKELKYIDISRRDAPCVCINNEIIIGDEYDTHASLISKLIHGIEIIDNDEELDLTKIVEDSGGRYYRDEIEEDNVIYGHILGSNMYWDILEDKTRSEVKSILSNARRIDGYIHYSLDQYKGISARLF